MSDDPRPSRRVRQQEWQRREILDAALDLFHQQGFHGTTVQQIAVQAEFGVGTLYRLFPEGKEEIYRTLQEQVVAAFEQELSEALADAPDAVEKLRRYIRAGAQVYAAYPREMTIYLRDTAGLMHNLKRGLFPELAERYMACAAKARDALVEGMRAGLIRPIDPEAATLGLQAVINGFLTTWLENPDRYSVQQSVAIIEDLFFCGVLGAVPEKRSDR